jgi:hypothetical protein
MTTEFTAPAGRDDERWDRVPVRHQCGAVTTSVMRCWGWGRRACLRRSRPTARDAIAGEEKACSDHCGEEGAAPPDGDRVRSRVPRPRPLGPRARAAVKVRP